MPVGKTVAEYILEIVKAMKTDMDEIKRRLGDDAMEPVDRRLKRLETKIHAMADGTFGKHDDGMEDKL